MGEVGGGGHDCMTIQGSAYSCSAAACPEGSAGFSQPVAQPAAGTTGDRLGAFGA
jgi:hypothetical protein